MKLDLTYLIHRVGSREFKIGHGYVADRLASLQTGNAGDLILIIALPGGKALETFLHEVFKPRHIRLEWFDFPNWQIARTLVIEKSDEFWELRAKHPGLRPEMLPRLAA